MAKDLTPAGSYNPTVTVPENGDARTAGSVETAFQALTDRTDDNKTRLDTAESDISTAQSDITALETRATNLEEPLLWVGDIPQQLAVSNGAKLDVEAEHNEDGAFLDDNNGLVGEVEVPSAGWYLIMLQLFATSSDTTDPTTVNAGIYLGATQRQSARTKRWSATAGTSVSLQAWVLWQVNNPSTERISIQNNNAGSATMDALPGSKLHILKLGNL